MDIPLFLGLAIIFAMLRHACKEFTKVRIANTLPGDLALEIQRGPDFSKASTWITLGISLFGALALVCAIVFVALSIV